MLKNDRFGESNYFQLTSDCMTDSYRSRCLAHIINLATQALISTRSKAKYHNPHNVDEHAPDVNAIDRDELGLVRAIAVKVRT